MLCQRKYRLNICDCVGSVMRRKINETIARFRSRRCSVWGGNGAWEKCVEDGVTIQTFL